MYFLAPIDSTIEFLKSKFSFLDIYPLEYSLFNSRTNKSEKYNCIGINIKEESHIHIFVSSDEWFYVEWQISKRKMSYYKCDQIDGLIKFIEDKVIRVNSGSVLDVLYSMS